MAQKTRANLKTQRTSTYKIGVAEGTTVANESQFMEDLLDSIPTFQDGEVASGGTKLFTTAGTGTAYTVADGDVTTNGYLEGIAFFVVFNTDSTGSATIQFNALTTLTIKVVSKQGTSNLESADIQSGVMYVATKAVGSDELHIAFHYRINDAGTTNLDLWSAEKIEDRVQKGLVSVAATGSLGVFTASIPHITVLGDLSNYFYAIYFNNSFSNGDTLNVNSLGAVTITTPPSSLSGDANYIYIFRYDGSVFRVVTDTGLDHIDTELSKGFFNGAIEEARIELKTSGLVGLNFTGSNRDFHFVDEAPGVAAANYIKIQPPYAGNPTGGIQVISTHASNSPELITFADTNNNTFADNVLISNDAFEEFFPPSVHQTLTDDTTVNFDLYKGFIGILDSGSATARTIDFKSTGSGGSGRVKKAQGYIYLDCDVTIDVSFELDGSDIRVMTIGGTHPLNIAGTSSNLVIIPYRFNYDFSGARLFIGDPEIYLGI